jgi:hypothetical protein
MSPVTDVAAVRFSSRFTPRSSRLYSKYHASYGVLNDALGGILPSPREEEEEEEKEEKVEESNSGAGGGAATAAGVSSTSDAGGNYSWRAAEECPDGKKKRAHSPMTWRENEGPEVCGRGGGEDNPGEDASASAISSGVGGSSKRQLRVRSDDWVA